MSDFYDWPDVQPPPPIFKRMEDRITVLYHQLQGEQKANSDLRAEVAQAQDIITDLKTQIESCKTVEEIFVSQRDLEKTLRQERDAEIERLRQESEKMLNELALAKEESRKAQHRFDRALGRLTLVFGDTVLKVVDEGEEFMGR